MTQRNLEVVGTPDPGFGWVRDETELADRQSERELAERRRRQVVLEDTSPQLGTVIDARRSELHQRAQRLRDFAERTPAEVWLYFEEDPERLDGLARAAELAGFVREGDPEDVRAGAVAVLEAHHHYRIDRLRDKPARKGR